MQIETCNKTFKTKYKRFVAFAHHATNLVIYEIFFTKKDKPLP